MSISSPTQEQGRSSLQAMLALFTQQGQRDNPWPVALVYLALFGLAEIVLVFVAVPVGLGLHIGLLFGLLLHTGWTWQRSGQHFLLGLIFVPLIRIISVTLPLASFPLVYWFFITSFPLFAAAYVVTRLLHYSWADAGLVWRGLPLQLLFGLCGIGLGTVEYFILRPDPLVDSYSLGQIVAPALILLISTGYLEELIFRRIMQRTAVERLGRWSGLIYVALLFAVLHIGYRSLIDFVFVLGVGLLFGWFVNKTNSLVGVTMAHGLTNVWLFLVMPFLTIAPLFTLPAVDPPVISAEVSVTQPASTSIASTMPTAVSTAAPLLESEPSATAVPIVENEPALSQSTDQNLQNESPPAAGFWGTYGVYVLLLVFGFLLTGLMFWKTP